MAGLAVLGACFAAMYALIGVFFGTMMPVAASSGGSGAGSSSGMSPADARVFEMMGWIYGFFGGLGALYALGLAVCLFLCARNLTHRRKWTFVFVIACIQCINMPLGTILGIFTIIVLQRPGVKALFDQPDAAGGSIE
jgi:hypothetical protein